MLLPLTLYTLALLALTALTLWSHHGRRIDDHPLCRKCEFDLTGKPEASTQCPECGADLTRPRSTRLGHRKRRTVPLVASVSLLSILLLLGGSTAFFIAKGTTFFPRLPTLPLTWLASHADDSRRPAALRELITRLSGNKLSPAQLDALADRLLARQANPKTTWDTEAGDLLQLLRGVSQLSDDRWKRYALQSVTFTLEPRPRITIGDPVPCILQSTVRADTPSTIRFNQRPFFYHVSEVAAVRDGQLLASELNSNINSYDLSLPRSLPAQLGPGKHELTVRLTFDVTELVTRKSLFGDVGEPKIVSGTVNLPITLVLLPPGQSSTSFLSSDATLASIRDELSGLTIQVPAHGFYDKERLTGLSNRNVDIPVAAEVTVFDGGQVLRRGSLLRGQSWSDIPVLESTRPWRPLPATVTVRLVAKQSLAAAYADLTEIAPFDITLRDVPVQNAKGEPATAQERDFLPANAGQRLPPMEFPGGNPSTSMP